MKTVVNIPLVSTKVVQDFATTHSMDARKTWEMVSNDINNSNILENFHHPGNFVLLLASFPQYFVSRMETS